MHKLPRHRRFCVRRILRAAAVAGPALFVLRSQHAFSADLSWDQVGGGALGGTGTWDVGNTWWDGGADVAWTDGNDAVFAGTAGIVTISGVVAPSSMTFQTTGYRVEGGLVNNMPSITLNSGVTATFASATGTNGFGTTFSLGSGSELVFAPPAVGTAYTYAGM